jgi:NAD(P)-dependent dehydrogenase (short-subunit alcohol dehydrogenase family)
VTDIDADAAKGTVELIEEDRPGGAEAIGLDVTDRAAVDRVVGGASARHGAAFDLLVNNAGTDRGSDLVDIDDDRWHAVFRVNLHGPMYLSRAFVRHRVANAPPALGGRPADIACVVSISALTVGAGAGAYNSSKAALLKLVEVMQTEARERSWPVRVSAINPAAMATPMMDQWGLPDERMMDPGVVADLIRFAVTLPPECVLQNAVITLRNESYPR